MTTPSVMQGLTNENTMLTSVSIEDLEEYKKNACKILKSQTQYDTAKIVEELIESGIKSMNNFLNMLECRSANYGNKTY